MNPDEIKNIREEYLLNQLNENDVNRDPFNQFNKWFKKLIELEISMPNTMILSTVDSNGLPSSRIVLLKGMENNSFIFFTNYESKKAKSISENPKISLLFYWKELERQVKIEGTVEKASRE